MVNAISPFNARTWDVTSNEGSKIRRYLTATAKISLVVVITMAVTVIVLVIVCLVLPTDMEDAAFWPSSKSDSKLGKFLSAAIATDTAPCASIGRDILERQGTAVDAAIAALVCAGAHNPQSSGIGGGFLMIYYNRTEQKAYFLDSKEVAPRNANEDMFKTKEERSEGGLSIAVPAELAGLSEAYNQFGGGVPWKDLFMPTAKLCRQGIVVNHNLAKTLVYGKKKLKKYEAIRNVFLKNGTGPYEEGELLMRPDLARTLEVIAIQGMRAVYGPSKLADQLLGDLKAAGSTIDRLDMENYAPRLRKPTEVQLLKNSTLYSSSIPGSGDILAFMLSVLSGYPEMNESVVRDERKASLTFHRMTETFKFAFAQRTFMEDEDSEKMQELVQKLLTREFADGVREKINDYKTFDDPSHYGGEGKIVEDSGTSHLSVLAPNGDAVSVTSSINQNFGSSVLSPSTGLILNNHMEDFSLSNIVKYFNMTAADANRIKPGRRPMSSMSPMILVDASGNVSLVLGASGGTTIPTSMLQVAARILFFSQDIKQAIDAPRFHHQLQPEFLEYESNFPKVMVEKLGKYGHKTRESASGTNGGVTGIRRAEDGHLYATFDYRKGGEVNGF